MNNIFSSISEDKEFYSKAFERYSREASEVVICSCYINFERITDRISRFLKKGSSLTVITSPTYTNTFLGLSKLKEMKNTKVYVVRNDKRLMHIKAYCFKIKGKWVNLTGSMNFTKNGLYTNIEMLQKTKGDEIITELKTLCKPKNLIIKKEVLSLESSSSFNSKLLLAVSMSKAGNLLMEPFSYNFFGLNKNDFPDDFSSNIKFTDNAFVKTDKVSGGFPFLESENMEKVRKGLNKLKNSVSQKTVYTIAGFGKISTDATIFQFKLNKSTQNSKTFKTLINHCNNSIKFLKDEEREFFEARAEIGITKRRDYFIKKLKKSEIRKKEILSELDALNKFLEKFDQQNKKERAIEYLQSICDIESKNPLDSIYQFSHFRLDSYLEESKHLIYKHLVMGIAKELLYRNLHKCKIDPILHNILYENYLLIQRKEDDCTKIENEKWIDISISYLELFIAKYEDGDLGWSSRFDFELWDAWSDILRSISYKELFRHWPKNIENLGKKAKGVLIRNTKNKLFCIEGYDSELKEWFGRAVDCNNSLFGEEFSFSDDGYFYIVGRL